MICREERDLIVRWVRLLRREAGVPPGELALGLRMPSHRSAERIYARMRALDPRGLPSAPSPRSHGGST